LCVGVIGCECECEKEAWWGWSLRQRMYKVNRDEERDITTKLLRRPNHIQARIHGSAHSRNHCSPSSEKRIPQLQGSARGTFHVCNAKHEPAHGGPLLRSFFPSGPETGVEAGGWIDKLGATGSRRVEEELIDGYDEGGGDWLDEGMIATTSGDWRSSGKNLKNRHRAW
jgi:hypothetical protein